MPFMLTLSSSDVVTATYDFTGQEGELSFKVCVSVIYTFFSMCVIQLAMT